MKLNNSLNRRLELENHLNSSNNKNQKKIPKLGTINISRLKKISKTRTAEILPKVENNLEKVQTNYKNDVLFNKAPNIDIFIDEKMVQDDMFMSQSKKSQETMERKYNLSLSSANIKKNKEDAWDIMIKQGVLRENERVNRN